MRIVRSALVALVASALIGCDAKTVAVRRMFEKAKRGQDTGDSWVGGVAEEKLFNVTDYRIMSCRPLSEAIREYVPKATEHYQESIEKSRMVIARSKQEIAGFSKGLPGLHRLATVTAPQELENDTVGNYDRMIEALTSFQHQCPESTISVPLHHITEARDRLRKGWPNAAADIPIQRAYTSFREVLAGDPGEYEYALREFENSRGARPSQDLSDAARNREIYDYAVHRLKEASGTIVSEEANIAACEVAPLQLEGYVNRTTGVAYKVRVNSTNKWKIPIVGIWTVTMIECNREWKVSGLYDEDDFAKQGNSVVMHASLLFILGKRQ